MRMDTHVLLHDVRAPLRMFGVHCPNPTGRHWSPAARRLEEFLHRFAPTLEKLELCNLFIDPNDTRDISTPSRSVFRMTQYPAVRSLSVCSLEGVLLLDPLRHTSSQHSTTYCPSTGSGRVPARSLMLISAPPTNVHKTAIADGSRCCAGKKLDQAVCGVEMFYVLGLRCPIRLVMLNRCSAHRKQYVVESLRENPVPRLKLSLRVSHALHELHGLFSPELGRTLTHLTLVLMDDQSTSERVMDADRDKMHMISSLLPLDKLTHLRVVIHCNVYDHPPKPNAHSKFMHALSRHSLDFEEPAASLVRLLPFLQYVFLTTSAWIGDYSHNTERRHVDYAWRVAEPDTYQMQNRKPMLVDLADEVVIRKGELVLSSSDEFALHKHSDD
ncbi:hypothetical protein LXA43DRAFT_1116179 [Ganoderma leucocontextum]|nr:hypothetical protein LXA43DRAFT_1116179 [Ganoderma leucocontextum]